MKQFIHTDGAWNLDEDFMTCVARSNSFKIVSPGPTNNDLKVKYITKHAFSTPCTFCAEYFATHGFVPSDIIFV